jgi:tetratricopeptide (TPR) repeat protein
LKHFTQAYEHLNTALSMYEKTVGENHRYTAAVYTDLAILGVDNDSEQFIDRGVSYLRSRQYMTQALAIFEDIYGIQHIWTSRLYDRMSRLWSFSPNEGDWHIALEYRERVIEINGYLLGGTSMQLIGSYYWKGRVLQKLHRDLEARHAYIQGLAIGKKYPNKEVYWIRKSEEQLQQLESLSSSAKL